jgi:hypothetical protein
MTRDDSIILDYSTGRLTHLVPPCPRVIPIHIPYVLWLCLSQWQADDRLQCAQTQNLGIFCWARSRISPSALIPSFSQRTCWPSSTNFDRGEIVYVPTSRPCQSVMVMRLKIDFNHLTTSIPASRWAHCWEGFQKFKKRMYIRLPPNYSTRTQRS